MKSVVAGIAILTVLLFAPISSHAQWQLDGAPVAAETGVQTTPAAFPDGSGGAYITWTDARSGEFDIYVQRLDAWGVPQWTPGGVAICTAADDQYYPALVADGSGGIIVVWQDQRTGNRDIYAQRLLGAGVPVWTADGVALCTEGSDQLGPVIVADGLGGAIVGWLDYRSGPTSDVYVQRVSGAGTPQWGTDGKAVCSAADDQINPRIVPDGAGGAILAWDDWRNGVDANIYAQRVDLGGAIKWAADGVALCTAVDDQFDVNAVSDGSGGAIVVWRDDRSGTSDIYAQRVNAFGLSQWSADGVGVCTHSGNQTNPAVTSDGSGGAIVAWEDYRDAMGSDVFAGRITSSGVPVWGVDGVALTRFQQTETDLTIAADGLGGAVVAWRDTRNGVDSDIYARRVDGAGTPLWTDDGVPLCALPGDNGAPVVVSDGAGNAIAAWPDDRGGDDDIYAQRVEGRFAYWGHPEPVVVSVADVPGDQGGKVNVNWSASGWDVLYMQTITHYSVWRATDPIVAAKAIAGDPSLLVKGSDVHEGFSGPAYRIEHFAAADYYWELVGSQGAQYFAGYSFSAETRADSTSQGTMTHVFQVLSHTADNFVFWSSNTMSGYSTDNLAPSAPLMLTADRMGSDVYLSWDPVAVGDLRDYAVYRATVSGVDPDPINFLSFSNDTMLVDTGAPEAVLHYVVTAVDVHGNESAASNEVSVSPATGVAGDAPALHQLTLLQNHPNPFNRSTTLRVGLTNSSPISIDVFDVRGRRVRSMQVPGAAGWRQIPFAGVDDLGHPLASGVYFYRVTTGGMTQTRKMVIAR